MKSATRQALMQKFAQLVVAFMQQANFSVACLHKYGTVPSRLGLMLFLVVWLCGCSTFKSSISKETNTTTSTNVTPIREIKPNNKNQTVVYIQGKVEKQAPLMKQWVYLVNDSTGKIWVLTNQKELQKGAQVVFKGRIRYKSIPVAGQELGEVYLEEE